MSEHPRKICDACNGWWRGVPDECPTCGGRDITIEDDAEPETFVAAPHDIEAHRQVARVENFAHSLHALPVRLANQLSTALHPYDVADAILDLLDLGPDPEPLAEWERKLLSEPCFLHPEHVVSGESAGWHMRPCQCAEGARTLTRRPSASGMRLARPCSSSLWPRRGR
jgi:hypothetical protein